MAKAKVCALRLVALSAILRFASSQDRPTFDDLPSTFQKGEKYNITYTPANDEDTNFYLYKGSLESDSTTLAENVRDGWWEWDVDTALGDADDYILALEQTDDGLLARIEITGDVVTASSQVPSTEIVTSVVTPTETATGESPTPYVIVVTSVDESSASTTETTTINSESAGPSTSSAPDPLYTPYITKEKGLSKGAKAGIGVGSVFGAVVLAVGALFVVMLWRRKREKVNPEEMEYPELVEVTR